MKQKFAVLLMVVALCYSCNDQDAQRIVPNSNGNINEVNIVIDNLLWENTIGEAIRDTLAATVDGLNVDEPQFKMSQMPPEVFTGFATKNRTVLKIEKGKEAGIRIIQDHFAKPQTLVLVTGMTNTEIINEIRTNTTKIVNAFKKEELKEKQRRISKSLFNDKELKNQLGISLKFPSAYRIAKNEDDFFWIRRDIPTGTIDMMVYDVPLSAIRKGDSAVIDVVRVRDSIGKIHIEGGVEGSFMATEDKYSPFIEETILDNKPAFETKGLWDLKNAFMSGPFLNYAIEDKVNKRYVIVEGYVFAPSVEKRDYMFELEAIIKSVSIK